MAVGDLLYEKVYDFTTNPSIVTANYGSGIALSNPAGQPLQVSVGADSGTVVFTGEPASTTHDCEVVITLRMPDDGQNRRHFGCWLMDTSGTDGTGYRGAGLDSDKQLYRFTTKTTSTLIQNFADTALGLNQDYVIKLSKTGNLIQLFVDGVLKASGVDPTYSLLRPGIFVYTGTVLVTSLVWRHKTSVYDHEVTKLFCSFDAPPVASEGRLPAVVTLATNQISTIPFTLVGSPAAARETANVKWGSACLAVDFAVNTRLVYPDSTSFALTTANPKWTVEYWVYRKTASATLLMGKSGRGNVSYTNWNHGISTNGSSHVGLGISGSYYGTSLGGVSSAAGAVPVGVWTHIAVTLNGPVAKIYINGVLSATHTASQHPGDGLPLPFFIGSEDSSGNGVSGCLIDSLRISSDVLYTDTFTPPSDYSGLYPPLVVAGYDVYTKAIQFIHGNHETPELYSLQHLEDQFANGYVYPGPYVGVKLSAQLLYRGKEPLWTAADGRNNRQGFISGKVTIKGIPASRKVLCLDTEFCPVAEVWSKSNGDYRFDHLWLDRHYFVVAIDRWDDHKYNPAAIDMKTPEPYL